MFHLKYSKQIITGWCFVISALLLVLTVSSFEELIDNSFRWDGEDGMPLFYMLPVDISNLEIASLTGGFVLAAAASASIIAINYLPAFYLASKKRLILNVYGISLLILLITATIYFIINTPIDCAAKWNVSFTMTDGSVASRGITQFQYYLFYVLGILSFITAFPLLIVNKSLSINSVLLVIGFSLTSFTVYQYLIDDSQRLIAGIIVLTINTAIYFSSAIYLRRN
jgi:hypothetical protein